MVEIRNVTLEDAEAILKIYEYYVLNTAITFEIEAPSLNEFKNRIEKISSKYPYICLLEDNKIVGYSYSHEFYGREAYKFSNEVTIYIDKDYQGKGYAKLLYNELEKRLKEKGILNLYACIAVTDHYDGNLTNNSEEFHQHFGYKRIGLFTKCGYKFNKWYDMIWMEKMIGDHK